MDKSFENHSHWMPCWKGQEKVSESLVLSLGSIETKRKWKLLYLLIPFLTLSFIPTRMPFLIKIIQPESGDLKLTGWESSSSPCHSSRETDPKEVILEHGGSRIFRDII